MKTNGYENMEPQKYEHKKESFASWRFTLYSKTPYDANNTFKINFEFKLIRETINKSSKINYLVKLHNELDDAFSDAILKVDGKEIRAYRNVLAAASDVFMTIFKNGSQEVMIDDIDYKTMTALIDNLYSGDLKMEPDADTVEDNLVSLLNAANKYKIKELLNTASLDLMSRINETNVIKIVTQSFLVGAKQLTDFCLNYMSKHEIVDYSECDGLNHGAVKLMLKEVIKQKSN